MNNMNFRRLMNEISILENNNDDDKKLFIINRVGDDIFHWEAIIIAPENSLYEGFKFKLDIQLPTNYPINPLKVKFITPILHLNVNKYGDICLDILKKEWLSISNMRTVLISIINLLAEPNVEDPLNHELANLYMLDKNKYKDDIIKYCKAHAIKI